jgi:predicted DNA-binding protein with PD1-like motif
VFLQEGAPALHFHAGIGRGDSALVGCPRAGMSVFLVLEVVIIELLGVQAARVLDEQAGLHLLRIFGHAPVTEAVEELE